MGGLTFRRKLALAMALVAVLATAAALVVTERTTAATTGRLFRERFAREGELFAALEDARLGAVREASATAARSVRLLAALEEAEPALLYRTAGDELREVLRPAGTAGAAPAAAFFRLLDASGRVVPPVDARAGLTDGDRRDLDADLARATGALAPDATQTVGYLAPVVGGVPRLHEVVLTRIVDPPTRRARGALALGFPFTPAPDAPPLRSRVLFDGRLYGGPEAERVGDGLAAAVAALADDPLAEPAADVDGVPHRVFARPLHAESPFPAASQVVLYSLAEPLAEQRALRLRGLAVGGLAVALALALGTMVARGLAEPVRRLVAAAAAVGAGDLSTRVPVRGRDELARLGAAFNEMTAGLALKERYRHVLDLVADRRVADDLLAGRLTLGGELRDVTVLFCDIRNFTGITADMPPAEVVAMLNAHMTACTGVVHAHGGVVNKFVGDALMALFGAPQPTGDDAGNAVRAARGIVAAREALNATGPHRVAVGVGVASGIVVAGCTGSSDRLEYTVLGTRVNLGARLAAHAGPMEILVDDLTRGRLAEGEGLDPLPPLRLKGFAEPVSAFRLRPEEDDG